VYHSYRISAKTSGEYSDALDNWHGAPKLKTAFNDHGYFFYKIGMIDLCQK
jgi:hypothetical protein